MQNLGDFPPNFGDDTYLFLQLAPKRLRRSFAGLDLPAGKLPLEWKRLVLGALTAQDFVAAQNERCHNLLGQTRLLELGDGPAARLSHKTGDASGAGRLRPCLSA